MLVVLIFQLFAVAIKLHFCRLQRSLRLYSNFGYIQIKWLFYKVAVLPHVMFFYIVCQSICFIFHFVLNMFPVFLIVRLASHKNRFSADVERYQACKAR